MILAFLAGSAPVIPFGARHAKHTSVCPRGAGGRPTSRPAAAVARQEPGSRRGVALAPSTLSVCHHKLLQMD